jgi:hypothetical protein
MLSEEQFNKAIGDVSVPTSVSNVSFIGGSSIPIAGVLEFSQAVAKTGNIRVLDNHDKDRFGDSDVILVTWEGNPNVLDDELISSENRKAEEDRFGR